MGNTNSRKQRIATLRKALAAKYGSRKYKITGGALTEQVHVNSRMPNSIEEGWWLMGDLEHAEDWMGIERNHR